MCIFQWKRIEGNWVKGTCWEKKKLHSAIFFHMTLLQNFSNCSNPNTLKLNALCYIPSLHIDHINCETRMILTKAIIFQTDYQSNIILLFFWHPGAEAIWIVHFLVINTRILKIFKRVILKEQLRLGGCGSSVFTVWAALFSKFDLVWCDRDAAFGGAQWKVFWCVFCMSFNEHTLHRFMHSTVKNYHNVNPHWTLCQWEPDNDKGSSLSNRANLGSEASNAW